MASQTPTSTTIELGGKSVTIERVSARKASTALALMRHLSAAMPGLQTELAEFRRRYERENVLELDRVQARMRNPARPMVDSDGNLILTERKVNDAGEVLVEGGRPVMLPSPVDRMSEEDWQQAGGVYRVPSTPATYEIVAALFSTALEVAEEHVYKLLALFTMPNEEVARRRKDNSLLEHLAVLADELVDDNFADELLELAVVAGEVVDTQFKSKLATLEGRVGKVLALVGIKTEKKVTPTTDAPTSSDGSSSSTPSSSTDSPANTPAGPPTPSSSSPTSSSSSSDGSSSSTETATSSPPPVEAT